MSHAGTRAVLPEIAGASRGFPAVSRHRLMSELAFLEETLRATARRRRFDRALGGLWKGLLAGAVLWLVVLVLYKVAPLPPVLAENGWYITLAGALGGLLIGGWRSVPLAAAARLVEARQALNQRLSTALEIAPEAASSPWSRLVLADAARAIQGLHLGRLLPLRLPAAARWTPAVLLAVVGLGFVPEYRSAAHLQRRKDAAVIRETGRQVAELVRREAGKREPGLEPVREALEAAAMSGERLSQVKLTREEALKDLANAAARLQQESEQLGATPALRKLQQAARTPGGSSASPGSSAFRKQLEKLQQSLPNAGPDALEKLAKQLEQAQRMAAGMQGNPDGSAAAAMSAALDQLARSAAALGLDARGLERALEAMKNLDFDRVLQGLQMAGTDLDKMRDLASKLAEMQKSMQELGKDLAEQLDRGQAEAAARTLEKMVEQLKTSGLSPGEMEKLVAEVGKALQPAKEYGEVARLLGEAARQLQESQGGEASRNLARAAEELRRLARESQDMEQLADVLSALQQAQVAIASGQSWKPGTCKGGNCKGCLAGTCRGLRAGPGGRPGRGVGTWADENGWLYYPEISERWDNSGLQRPDQAARGHTDRGPVEQPENLAPTKLQGRFTPGPMPSITLRGVSIKGESTVPYQQAVETAQSDARSALNQDQVPRAYRGAVKGYFDDLQ